MHDHISKRGFNQTWVTKGNKRDKFIKRLSEITRNDNKIRIIEKWNKTVMKYESHRLKKTEENDMYCNIYHCRNHFHCIRHTAFITSKQGKKDKIEKDMKVSQSHLEIWEVESLRNPRHIYKNSSTPKFIKHVLFNFS